MRVDGVPTSSAAGLPSRRQSLLRSAPVREVLIGLLIYLAYGLARYWAHGGEPAAFANAWAVLEAEQAVGLDVERTLNAMLGPLPLVALASCYFYATAHYLVTPLVLVWLFRRRRSGYGRARTVLITATWLGFVGHWLMPTAPPRMLPGYDDTMASWASWGWWGEAGGVPAGIDGLANELAAMPSLHVAWASWCGWQLYRHAARVAVRVLAVAYPLVTVFVVTVTANHFLLDAVAGVAVFALGAAVVAGVAWALRRRASVLGPGGSGWSVGSPPSHDPAPSLR